MVFDLSRQHQKLLEDIFKTHTPSVEVWAYGSRTHGRGHAGSDLDLVLRDPATPLRPLEGLGRLRDAISESNIPFPVDLHDWALLPETFRQRIEKSHVILFAPEAAQQS